MTLLSLLVAGYKTLQKRLDEQYTYQSMEHLDERLLIDVGVCRRGNSIIALSREDTAALEDEEITSCLPSSQSGCAERGEHCCLLQGGGG